MGDRLQLRDPSLYAREPLGLVAYANKVVRDDLRSALAMLGRIRDPIFANPKLGQELIRQPLHGSTTAPPSTDKPMVSSSSGSG